MRCNPGVQANGLNVSRVFLYNLDYGPTSLIPHYAPTAPSNPSMQVPGPVSRLGLPPAPAPAPTGALPAGTASTDAAAAGPAPAQQAGAQNNTALIGGQRPALPSLSG